MNETAVDRTADQGKRRAWGWVHHLRDGGTTPWAAWEQVGEALGAVVPGAQQLELLRRLNHAGPVSPELVDRVLGASAVDRGQPDLELVGAFRDTPFGPRPVDPADVTASELLRVATAILSEDLVSAGPPPAPRARRPVPWRTRYRLIGDAELVRPLVADLVARGRPPGGRDARVVLLGADLGRMLADAWTNRCFDQRTRPWRGWLQRRVRLDRLPGHTDLAREAHRWSRVVGPQRVHVVLDPAALPEVLGVRSVPSLPEQPAAVAPDLARRVASVLGLHVPGDERTALLRRRLRPILSEAPGLPLGIPHRHLGWVRGHAERMASEIRGAGYAVHGAPERLLPADRPTVVAPSDTATLELALRLMLTGSARASEESS